VPVCLDYASSLGIRQGWDSERSHTQQMKPDLGASRGSHHRGGRDRRGTARDPYFYRVRCETSYPTREEYFTVSPALAENKTRSGFARFETKWRATPSPNSS